MFEPETYLFLALLDVMYGENTNHMMEGVVDGKTINSWQESCNQKGL